LLCDYCFTASSLFRGGAAAGEIKILKDAEPPDIQFEQPTEVELAINLKASKQIDLSNSS
jgi:ABC-type uncharacterized transport system substrate-binding protein